ncbi:hypothetical protein RB195_000634 [Necator americanus]|uniref:Otopetrin n=1 Tax=Necator americanus TaxID=51031 RepID=A0ABR1DBZ4_NECAM
MERCGCDQGRALVNSAQFAAVRAKLGGLGATAPCSFSTLELPRRNRRFSSKIHRVESCRPELVHSWISSSNFGLRAEEQVRDVRNFEESPHREMVIEKCESGYDYNSDNAKNAGKARGISRQDSTLSFESIDDSSDMKTSAEETWNQSKEAKAVLLTALTAFYSLFLTIFALVLELSHLLSGEELREINTKDLIFGAYMYGVSILFFVYMYVVLLLNPRWYWSIQIVELSITGHHTAARFGTMHLIAANLWTWIRYVLMEEGVMEKEIREVFQAINNRSMSSMDEESTEAFEHRDIELTGGCQAAECILGSLSEVMFTAIVEYSLIAAAVMYIVWRNIGKAGHGSEYVKRKHRIRVDCSKTTTGLFLGLAFLAATFTSMIVYYGYSILGKSKNAAFAYALTDISQELLDQILLWVGLVGELIYSVAGIVGLTGDRPWQPLAFILFFVHIIRLIQVGTQTFLIYLAAKVRVGSSSKEKQPGKQAITFLLAANLSIFLMNLFESEKPGISESIIAVDVIGKDFDVEFSMSFAIGGF